MLRSPNLSAVSTTLKTLLPFGGIVEIPQVSPLNPLSSTSKWRFNVPSFKVITVALHEPVYADVSIRHVSHWLLKVGLEALHCASTGPAISELPSSRAINPIIVA